MDATSTLYKAITDGVIDFDGAHDIHTPRALVEEILEKVPLTGSVLVLFNVEFVISLVYTYKVDPQRITFYSDHENKNVFCDRMRVKYITSLETDMKFDVVVGNPPYDRGIKTNFDLPFKNIGPHAAFTYLSHQNLKDGGVFAVVLPCNFMCLPSAKGFRNWFVNNFQINNINVIDNTGGKVFNIGLSDIVTIIGTKKENPDNTSVLWNDSFNVDITKYDLWPMYKTAASVSIFDKLMTSRVSTIPFTGGKEDTPTDWILSTHLTRLGQRQNPSPQKMFVKDKVKDVAIPVWFGYSSEKEKNFQWEWLGTDHYAYVLSMVQSTPKNQPFLFQYLGEHNFVHTDFNKHFGVTQEESDEIAQWKATF